MKLALQPANRKNRIVQKHFDSTIETKVRFHEHTNLLDAETLARLNDLFPEGAARMWGVTPGKKNVNVGKWTRLRAGDPVAFYGDKQIYGTSHIGLLFHNVQLAERLWNRDEESGQTWEYMYALSEFRRVEVPIEEIRKALGWGSKAYVMGFTVVEDSRAEDLADLINLEVDSAYAEHAAPPPAKTQRSASTTQQTSTPPEGSTDGFRTASWRREHRALKRRLVELADGECALCGRTFPPQFLVGAHIKKRERCSEEERKDFDNVGMLACTLGCDSLFEHGYVGVGPEGELLISRAVDASVNVKQHVSQLGSATKWWTAAREPYFAWHRTHTFQNLDD